MIETLLDQPARKAETGLCPLHDGARSWPLTNCYVDLWIEVLHAWGLDPRAALPFTLTQDFEGDQFTFFKYPLEDLESAYGIMVHELAIFDGVDQHVEVQQRRGNLTLVEVDGFYLPDTQGTSYRIEHQKTTIGIDRISRSARTLGYFHNSGYHTLLGDDYDAIFGLGAAAPSGIVLPPYVEVAKRRFPGPRGADLRREMERLIARHLVRRPAEDPIRNFQSAFPAVIDMLLARDAAFFHVYSFNTMRQLGANFEMLGSCLGFLREHGAGGLDAPIGACGDLANAAKLMQFRMARMQARQRRQDCDDLFDALSNAYAQIMRGLELRGS